RCQLSENTPPTMWLDRNWNIQENQTVGTQIAQVHGNDAEGVPLTYGLEPIQLFYGSKNPPEELPFRIDQHTGTVYLNESLKGRAGQNLHLYVTAYDGELTAKTEVNVNILNPAVPFNPSQPNRPPFSLKKPAEITNKNTPTELKPVTVEKEEIENAITEKTEIATSTKKTTTTKSVENDDVGLINELLSTDDPVKSPPEFTATVIPIISVCAVFLTVGIIAVVFRKKIYVGKSKDSKEDMRKESSGAIVLREDPGINMQEWRGPRAFSNRYEPWQTDADHAQVGILNNK
ncbi:hypothetical protein NQ314_011081, partial [Rhamnusium bicolor]